MKKIIYILPLLLFSLKGLAFNSGKVRLQTQEEATLEGIGNYHRASEPPSHEFLMGDPIEYLFGMVHRNLNKIYAKCGRYPLESEMPEALFEGEIKKLNCKIDGGLPDWKVDGNIRYPNFGKFPLGRASFEEKRLKYFSNNKKFILLYNAPKKFIEQGRKASITFRGDYYSNGFLGSIKGKVMSVRIEKYSTIASECSLLHSRGIDKSFCYVGKKRVVQYDK